MAIDLEGKPSRAQDLYKTELLCGRCEGILNNHETFFANAIFYPFQRNALTNVPQDERLAKFTVSVSLRALWVMRDAGHPLTLKWGEELDRLEVEWREYLLDSPQFKKGSNSHHVLLCDEDLLKKGLRASPNLIHSVMRSSAYYIFEKFDKAYVFANLAGVQIASMIFPEDLPVSRGTQVYPTQTFGSVLPAGIGWGGYFQNLLELAGRFDAARARQTENQKARVDRAMKTERAAHSEDVRILLKQQHHIRDKDGDDPPAT